MSDDLAALPAVPSSCCAKFFKEEESAGRKVVTIIPPPGLRKKVVRELTVAEARRAVCFLVCRGDIELVLPGFAEFKCKNTPAIEITSPPLETKHAFFEVVTDEIEENGKKKKVSRAVFDPARDFMGPARVGIKSTIKFSDLPGRPQIVLNNLNNTKDAPAAQVCLNLDFRNLVGLYKLTEMLVTDFGATELLHAGIGAGRGPCTDCHNAGRAIDFSGLKGRTSLDASPAQAYDIRVLANWGRKPIIDQSGKPAGSKQGDVFFWSATDNPFFRLLSQGSPAPTTFEERLAINLFTAIYDFAAREYVERGFHRGAGFSGTDPAPPDPSQLGLSQIGNATFILHPDAPKGNSLAHTDHMHFQIGPTGFEDQHTKVLGDPAA